MIQPKYVREESKTPLSLDKVKSKQIGQDPKSSVFLQQIQKQGGIADTDVYNHCFHALLLQSKDSLQSYTDHVISSIQSREDLPGLSVVDVTRIQLQLVSLCTVSDDGSISLKESLLKGISLTTWCWSPEEKSVLQLRLKSKQKRETVEEIEGIFVITCLCSSQETKS